MQEKESIMVVQCELKIPSFGITSYPCDRIFNPHLTSHKDSYSLTSKSYFACTGNIHVKVVAKLMKHF